MFRSRHDDDAVSVLIDELLKLFALVRVAEARRPFEHRIRLGGLGRDQTGSGVELPQQCELARGRSREVAGAVDDLIIE